MSDEPKISILMGIYNCQDTLGEAIESIFAQTYANWELILCDDGSKDGTYALAEKYVSQRPDQCVLLRNETNMKLSYTLNHCLQAATGELVARMDADDLSHPDRFEKQVNFLREHPDIQLVGTAMQSFDEAGPGKVIHPIPNPDKNVMRNGVPFFHATIMTYKYVYDALNGYTVADRANGVEDIDLWFRFFAKGFKGANMTEILYDVRDDMSAVRRRTLARRIRTIKTLSFGYRLLGFPRYRLIVPATVLIIKGLVPPSLAKWIRKL